MNQLRLFLFAIPVLLLSVTGTSQMITGSWKGRINRQKVEVKIIQSGDSLTGTSYYFESHNNYRRYSIKGYFDPVSNMAVWWDDQLLEEKSGKFNLSIPGKIPMLSRADFNCPGGGRMMLDGNAATKSNDTKPTGEVHLDKTSQPEFEDEWDYVIDNYLVGGNDPEIIDSIAALSLVRYQPENPVEPEQAIKTEPGIVAVPKKETTNSETIEKPKPVITEPVKKPGLVINTGETVAAPTIEEKFIKREKVLVKEIPVTGDSIELRFYDNAEIDGDSISLFLNGRLLFQHIRLAAAPYIIKLSVAELNGQNELIMVAENLGAIPPNTSYMLAISGDKRYDAYLASSEGSSAMIRFVKQPH